MKIKRLPCFYILAILLVFCPARVPAAPAPGDRAVADIKWSRTAEPNGFVVLPAAGWRWSDVENINHDETTNVWDGGSIGSGYIQDAYRSWDIATWHTKRAMWNWTADVRRFQGEFTIPEGYNVYDDAMLSSAGDYRPLGLSDIIAINDNIYIFIYPKDQHIDNGNFLEYFAFWTGTACQDAAKAVNSGQPITFHGILGTTPHDYKEISESPIPPENLLSHTDGWYCDTFQNNIGHILQKSPDSREFVIDLFVEDFAEDGGMDRLELIFTKTADGEMPETETPGTETPETETPETGAPETETPETETPETEAPEVNLPNEEIPKGEIPFTETFDKGTSEWGMPLTEILEEETPKGWLSWEDATLEKTPEEDMLWAEIFEEEVPKGGLSGAEANENDLIAKTGDEGLLPYLLITIGTAFGLILLSKKMRGLL